MKKDHRILLFLFGCMFIRILLIFLAKYGSKIILNIMAILFLCIAMGMLNTFLYRPKKLGAFGGDPWWNNLRPIHSVLYIIFAIIVLTKYHSSAWVVLLLDVILGFIAFSFHYFL